MSYHSPLTYSPLTNFYSGRQSCQVRTITSPSNARQAKPMSHQLAGRRVYSVKPGVSAAFKAAATGLNLRTVSTALGPKGAPRPSQTSRGPTQTANKAL